MLHDVQQHSVVIPVSACVSLGMAGASAHRVGNFEAWGWLAPLFATFGITTMPFPKVNIYLALYHMHLSLIHI